MYALLITFKTAPGKLADVKKVADQAFAQSKGMKGFKSEAYLLDTVNNEYGSLSVWETKEDMETAFTTISPKLQDAYQPLVIEPPIRRIYEVYEPKP
jgi:heme-degrading monooxygenase HmoA